MAKPKPSLAFHKIQVQGFIEGKPATVLSDEAAQASLEPAPVVEPIVAEKKVRSVRPSSRPHEVQPSRPHEVQPSRPHEVQPSSSDSPPPSSSGRVLVERKDGRKLRRTTIYMTPELARDVGVYCLDHGTEMTAVVSLALRQFLDTHRSPSRS